MTTIHAANSLWGYPCRTGATWFPFGREGFDRMFRGKVIDSNGQEVYVDSDSDSDTL